MSERPIRITRLQAVEWGSEQTKFLGGLIKQVAEEKAGEALEWVTEHNIDAQVLLPVNRPTLYPPTPAEAYARIDFFHGHLVFQHLPAYRDRVLRDLLNLVDAFKSGAPTASTQIAEVEKVKE